MLYRDLQGVAESMDGIHAPLRQAILAGSTNEMTEQAEQAETAATQVLRRLQAAVQGSAASLEAEIPEGRGERVFAQAAVKALQQAVTQAQRILPGTEVSRLRAGLLECKTQANFADVYLRAALGEEET